MFKKILNHLLMFLLAICFFLLILCLIFSKTIFSKNYMLKVLEDNNYYEKVFYNINDTLKGYTIQSGLDVSIIDSLYDEKKVVEDINILIDGIYENKEIKIDTLIIEKRLNNIINNKIELNHQILTKEDREAIKSFVTTVSDVYRDEIIFSKDVILEIQKNYSKLNDILLRIIYIFIIIIISFFIFIIFLNQNIKEIIKKISISLLTTAILLVCVKIFLFDKFQHILIINSIFSKTLISLINNILNIIFKNGIIIGIVGLLGSIISIDYKKIK